MLQVFAEDKVHRFAINMCELEDAGEVKCVFRKDVTTAQIIVDREYPPHNALSYTGAFCYVPARLMTCDDHLVIFASR